MKTMIVESCLTRAQNAMYDSFRDYAKENEVSGRLCAIPVALADILLQTLKIPLTIIEHIAFAAINLFGAAFSENCTVKDALTKFQELFGSTTYRIVALPLQLIYQIVVTTYDPQEARTISLLPHIGDPAAPLIAVLHDDYKSHKPLTLLTNDQFLSWLGIVTPQPAQPAARRA